jgi:hypothetical protein
MEKLFWFKVIMFNMFRNKKVLDYVELSQEKAIKRWQKEYKDSSWTFDSVYVVEKIDGHAISLS